MSTFTLKLIAIITMLIDHMGAVFGPYEGWALLGGSTYNLMRSIGRIAFPLFCFCLVSGFAHSSNRKHYIGRVFLSAALSQIPFTLAFAYENHLPLSEYRGESSFLFSNGGVDQILISLGLFVLFCLLQDEHKPNRDSLYFLLALLVSCFSLEVGNIYILDTNSLNVCYTLGMGLLMLQTLSSFKKEEKTAPQQKILLLLLMAGTIYLLCLRSDYDYYGLFLILLLYLAQRIRGLQFLFMVLWSGWLYAWRFRIPFNSYMLYACIPSLLVLFYNDQKGPSLRYFFYGFYPVHLFLLGLFNCFMRLKA